MAVNVSDALSNKLTTNWAQALTFYSIEFDYQDYSCTLVVYVTYKTGWILTCNRICSSANLKRLVKWIRLFEQTISFEQKIRGKTATLTIKSQPN